jgi:cytosine deaminase
MASPDFILRRARLSGLDALFDIAVEGSRIAAIAPTIPADAAEFDADGRFVCAGLVETHIHLDKAGIIGRCRICDGTLSEAVSLTSAAKAAFTVEDVHDRARAVLDLAISHGTTRLRTFVEIDPRAGFRSFEAILALKTSYAHLIDIEICAFAQEGLTNDPGTEAMLDAALVNGADLVGGCPYTDPRPEEHIVRIFDLGQKHDVAVDFHLDFDLNPNGSFLPTVIEQTEKRGWGGRVSVGHETKLSALEPDRLAAIGKRLATAGIGVVVLPATDLFLNGRDQSALAPRGVAPAHRLAREGATTAIATNNLRNPFTPFGDASLIRMANLYANVAQVGAEADLEAVFSMITTDAARLLDPGSNYGLRVGAPADLVILDAISGADAIASIAPALAGWKRGRPSFVRPRAALFR